MLAVRAGSIVFDGNETIISITGALDRDGKTVKDYPKSDAGRRSVPVDDYTADTARAWIKLKSEMAKDQGLKPSMSMLVCGPEMIPRTYQSWYRDWLRFAADVGFEGVRPYALRHTFATLNLANGENIKTVAVLSQGESGGPSQACFSPRSARTVSRSLCRIESICRFASKRFSSEQLGFTVPPQLSI